MCVYMCVYMNTVTILANMYLDLNLNKQRDKGMIIVFDESGYATKINTTSFVCESPTPYITPDIV